VHYHSEVCGWYDLKHFFFFLKEVIKAAFEDQKYNKNGNIVKYEYNLK